MIKDGLLTLIFVLSVQNSQSDMALNKFKSELGDWTKYMPKVWHKYIKIYLYRFYLEDKIRLSGDNVRNILLQIVERSKSVLLYGNTIRFDAKWFMMCPMEEFD